MTDTGRIPGEGQPENAGGQQGAPQYAAPATPAGAGPSAHPDHTAPGPYSYPDAAETAPGFQDTATGFQDTAETVTGADDDDLLLMPGVQGAWSEQPAGASAGPGTAPGPESPDADAPIGPIATPYQPPYEPGPHEAGGRDAGTGGNGAQPLPQPSAERPAGEQLSAEQHSSAAPQPPPARRPLHMGPPVPDSTGGVVRSLADRGPTGAPPARQHPASHTTAPRSAPRQATVPRQGGHRTLGPEHLDVQQPQPVTVPAYVQRPESALPGPQLGEIPERSWAPQPPPETAAAVEDAAAGAAVAAPAAAPGGSALRDPRVVRPSVEQGEPAQQADPAAPAPVPGPEFPVAEPGPEPGAGAAVSDAPAELPGVGQEPAGQDAADRAPDAGCEDDRSAVPAAEQESGTATSARGRRRALRSTAVDGAFGVGPGSVEQAAEQPAADPQATAPGATDSGTEPDGAGTGETAPSGAAASGPVTDTGLPAEAAAAGEPDDTQAASQDGAATAPGEAGPVVEEPEPAADEPALPGGDTADGNSPAATAGEAADAERQTEPAAADGAAESVPRNTRGGAGAEGDAGVTGAGAPQGAAAAADETVRAAEQEPVQDAPRGRRRAARPAGAAEPARRDAGAKHASRAAGDSGAAAGTEQAPVPAPAQDMSAPLPAHADVDGGDGAPAQPVAPAGPADSAAAEPEAGAPEAEVPQAEAPEADVAANTGSPVSAEPEAAPAPPVQSVPQSGESADDADEAGTASAADADEEATPPVSGEAATSPDSAGAEADVEAEAQPVPAADDHAAPDARPVEPAVAAAEAEPASVPAGQPSEGAPEPAPESVPEAGATLADRLVGTRPAPETAKAEEADGTEEAEGTKNAGGTTAAEPEPAPAPAPDSVPTAEDEPAEEPEPEPAAEHAESAPESPKAAPAAPRAAGYGDAEREAVLRVMRERRDIRNGFRSEPVPHDVLLRVLEAAHTAPSVGHSQPWDFVVIRSAETRQAMHELAVRQRDAYARSLPKARAKQFKELKIEAILDTPVNIVVTADPTRGGRHTLGRHTQPQMAPYSSALAVENLWLAARAEGLGVGWVSFFDEREMVRVLGLPEHLEVVAYLCVGYVDEFPAEPELMQAGWSKRRPLSWVVHEETYGRRALPGEEPHDLLRETLQGIRPLDAKALGEAWDRQKRMTKPAGALGMLEIISAQLSGLSRKCPPPIPEPAAVAIFAGDHGVHAQGVTPWPQEVTGQMVANFLSGGAVCNAFANQIGAEVCVIDVGVAAELPSTPGLLPRKVRHGTNDFTTGPAMEPEDVLRAVEVGIETARDLVAAGNKALLTGEMGIANTTVSAALVSVYTGQDPAEVTGRGTGISDETHAHKVEVVRRALELHRPDPADPLGVLAAVGGLEHAALVGLILGGASLRTPVILDGVSAGAAALVARAIAPESLAACIAGHRSAEPGHVAALTKLGLRPLVDLDLRLGEGTGALLALPIVQSAARAMHEVATFDSAGVTKKV